MQQNLTNTKKWSSLTYPGPDSGQLLQYTTQARVLRLVVVDGQMELRLCGARVNLGGVEI
jgi:hypothetical protein